MAELFTGVEAAILEADADAKCAAASALYPDWCAGELSLDASSTIQAIDDPGRPQYPDLVDPRELGRRSVATDAGRILMLHAFAHIEFNAILVWR